MARLKKEILMSNNPYRDGALTKKIPTNSWVYLEPKDREVTILDETKEWQVKLSCDEALEYIY